MTLIVKNVAGMSFPKPDGSLIDLKGGCLLNTIKDEDYKYLCDNFKLEEMIDKGFVTVGGKTETAIDDTKQAIKDKQDSLIKENENRNGVKLSKAN